MKKLTILLIIFVFSSCVSKRTFENRIAQLEQTIQSMPSIRDKPLKIPENWDGGVQIIGSGLAVTPSDNIEMATPDTVAWDHDCLSLTSIPCSHSRRFVRRQIWSPTGIQGPICDPGKKGTPGWDGYPRTDTIIIENYYLFIHQF